MLVSRTVRRLRAKRLSWGESFTTRPFGPPLHRPALGNTGFQPTVQFREKFGHTPLSALRVRWTKGFPDLLGIVHKRGEVAFIRVERHGTMGQRLCKQMSRSRRHEPVLLSLREEQVLKHDRFDGKVPRFAVDDRVPCRCVCCLPETFSRGLRKSLSDEFVG